MATLARAGLTAIGAGVAAAYQFGYFDPPPTRAHEVYKDPFYVPPDFKNPLEPNPHKFISTVRKQGREMRSIDLRHTPLAQNGILSEIAANCPRLRELRISETVGRVSDQFIAVVILACPELTLLDISGTGSSLTDEGIRAIYESARDIESLRIHNPGESVVTATSLLGIVNRLGPQLKHLAFSYDVVISDAELERVAQKCAKLEMLDVMAFDNKITDAGAMKVLQECKNLQYLDVTGKNGITDRLLAELAQPEFAPQLKVLKVATKDDGGYVDKQAVEDLRLLRPGLVVESRAIDDVFTASVSGI